MKLASFPGDVHKRGGCGETIGGEGEMKGGIDEGGGSAREDG